MSYHRSTRIYTSLATALLAFGGLIHAQRIGPQQPPIPLCMNGWNLFDNAGNTPCEALVNVMDPCASADNGLPFSIGNITSEPLGVYPAPASRTTALERCQCTEVGYNLYSACAACQLSDGKVHWLSHDKWFGGCGFGSSEIPTLPQSGANETNIATWMTKIYTPIFSIASALSAETGGPLLTPSSTEFPASADTNGSTASTASPNSSNLVGIIVGSVVGGIALLAILALIIFLRRRRQKQHTAPSAEFMKYSSAREPLRAHSRANTTEEDGHTALMHKAGYAPHRGSVVRVDSPDNGGGGGGGYGDIEMAEGSTPPAFTPGLFKDPIFEKGVALNLAASSGGVAPGGTYGSSPVTYSPVTPSTAHAGMERQGLIQSRRGTE